MNMDLRELTIGNFKCFPEFKAQLPRITLLTGANSSGKSSLINAILSVAQSPEFPFAFSPNGELVSMGDYAEMVYNHEREREITLNLTFSQDETPSFIVSATFESSGKTREPKLLKATISYSKNIEFSITRLGRGYQAHYKVLANAEDALNASKEFQKIMQAFLTRISELGSKTKKKNTKQRRMFDLNAPPEGTFKFKDFATFSEKVSSLPFVPLISPILEISKEFFSKKFNYVGPFRIGPERTYYRRTKEDLTIDKFGANAVEQLVEWQVRRSKLYKETVDALRQLGLVDKLQVENLDGGRFEIRVATTMAGVSSSFTDVGFGISQFLPVLVADFQLHDSGLLAISQPEIHLHPKSQALYGEFIADRVKRTKRSYILETHSEYIINRIRLKVAKGELAESDVGLYYLEHVRGVSQIHRIEISKSGELKNAPDSFFDTYMIDTMNIALEAQL